MASADMADDPGKAEAASPGPASRRRVVIGIPFELTEREAAHREADARATGQARRAAERARGTGP